MKKLVILLLFLVLPLFIFAKNANAWFGAGKTPGWLATTTGLTGEIALPEYKFAPDFYTVGDTVSINVLGSNLNNSDVTSHYYLAISKVTEAPIGTDISDGTPTTPGLNENQLYDYHQSNNDVQAVINVFDLGNKTFPANGNLTFNGSYTTNQTGYFQFDFIDIDPTLGYQPGHILAAGFFRVLTGNGGGNTGSPTPTPGGGSGISSPTPTASSDPVNGNSIDLCKNLDGIQTSIPDTYHQAGENCLQFELGGAPQSNDPGNSSNNSGGQVLGASTTNLANTSSDLIIPRILGSISISAICLIAFRRFQFSFRDR